jgi:hypothetical protein
MDCQRARFLSPQPAITKLNQKELKLMRKQRSGGASYYEHGHVRLLSRELRAKIKITGITRTKHKHTAHFLLMKSSYSTASVVSIILKISDDATISSNCADILSDVCSGEAQQARETMGDEVGIFAFYINLFGSIRKEKHADAYAEKEEQKNAAIHYFARKSGLLHD